MFSYQYHATKIQFDLIKSKRKTCSITVDTEGNVVVKAPLRLSDEKVVELVQGKSQWISQKLLAVNETKSKRYDRQYTDGEVFFYLGREYVLQVIEGSPGKKAIVTVNEHKILVTLPACKQGIPQGPMIKEALTKWYRQMATLKIVERVTYYEIYFIEKHGPIIIKEQKKRWGSCTQNGTLRFNWKIIMAPEIIIDYLVVHEMCHLRYMNHAKEFWNLVEQILPDYKSRREWLRKNGVLLEL